MLRHALIFGALLFLSIPAAIEAKEPKEFAENFFKMVQAGTIPEAYDQLFQGSPIPTQKPQAIDALKRQTASNLPLYGSLISFEQIRE